MAYPIAPIEPSCFCHVDGCSAVRLLGPEIGGAKMAVGVVPAWCELKGTITSCNTPKGVPGNGLVLVAKAPAVWTGGRHKIPAHIYQ